MVHLLNYLVYTLLGLWSKASLLMLDFKARKLVYSN